MRPNNDSTGLSARSGGRARRRRGRDQRDIFVAHSDDALTGDSRRSRPIRPRDSTTGSPSRDRGRRQALVAWYDGARAISMRAAATFGWRAPMTAGPMVHRRRRHRSDRSGHSCRAISRHMGDYIALYRRRTACDGMGGGRSAIRMSISRSGCSGGRASHRSSPASGSLRGVMCVDGAEPAHAGHRLRRMSAGARSS
jgi:hypothetical protein